KPKTCPTCHGSGQMRFQQGFFSVTRPCSACHGQGEIIEKPCPTCHGSGQEKVKKSISFKIPAGIENNTRMRLSGKGEAGIQGGPPGDLYVEITVEKHAIFQREGQDIICEVPVSFPQAALGCEIEVPTLNGKEKMKISAGTQSGTVIKLAGRGVASLRGYGKGDQLVVVRVETPTKLTERQRELLEEFNKDTGNDGEACHHPLRKSFFDKVKELFG
ncbi:MAG: molecular chaperone DnaJ, partial [Deltaproteobacteria bacterium]|nr:molecular chaperone DnaJ [Deltaproteobacteria bacterium]